MRWVKVTTVKQGKQVRKVLNIPKGYWPDDDYVLFDKVEGVTRIREASKVKYQLMGLDEPNEQET